MQERVAGVVAAVVGVALAGAAAFGVVTTVGGNPDVPGKSDPSVEQTVMDYGTNQTTN